MKLALGPYIRFSRILLFPLAMVIYDFSAYLTTDLIQPGIIHIIREFEADVALAPASVSLYLAGGLALQWLLGPLSDRIGRRPVLLTGAIIFALACFSMIFVTSIDQYLIARFIQDPTSPRFIWRTIPIQLTGLLVLLAGNIAWPHTWWWSVSGTSLYALGTGLLFPVLFRFALFSHSLPKGTVSATINIVALSFMAASVEVARWVYFQAGGRIAFHCLALIAGIVVIMLVSRLLKLRQQHLLQPA